MLLASVDFAQPQLVGAANFSAPRGSRFWFPGISIATGRSGHVAQHITLSGDGGSCNTKEHPQDCEQIMITRDGGHNYSVVKKIPVGTSGNFNGYNDLGTWVPAGPGPQPSGLFSTIVACNDCAGGAMDKPAFLQTWIDDDMELRLVSNRSVTFSGTPAAFAAPDCGLSSPSQSIVRTRDGRGLVMASYGHASDAPMTCTSGAGGKHCYTTGFHRSDDNGETWSYLSRIDQTPGMPTAVEGPCEPSLALLANGSLLVVFRLQSGVALWQATSVDGRVWSNPTPTAAWAVWPQLLTLSNGVLVLAAGRPGIGFWTTANDGADWVHHDVIAEHNKRAPAASQYDNTTGTTAYTGIAEVEPGVVLLAYDRTGAGRVGDLQQVFSMRITVAPP